MDDLLLMDVGESSHDLLQIVLCLQFADAFSFFEHFVKRVVAAQFEHHIDVVCIFEDVIECHHVAMLKCLVNFDLSDKLRRWGSTFCFALLFFSVSLDTILMAERR